jgi:hypothetical protein
MLDALQLWHWLPKLCSHSKLASFGVITLRLSLDKSKKNWEGAERRGIAYSLIGYEQHAFYLLYY